MSKSMNCAEAIDFMNKRVALGMFFVGITYFVIAAEKLVKPGVLNSTLDVVRLIGILLTALAVFLGMLPIIKLKMSGKFILSGEPESFMTDAMHTSFKNSWIVTMLATTLALAFQKYIDELNLDVSFFLIVLFGFMTFTASISFFYLTRSDDDDLEE